MNRLRKLIGPPAIVALLGSLICLVRANLGHFGVERYLFIPFLVLALATFTLAVAIAVRIGRSKNVLGILESGVGLYHAWLKAPVPVVAYSALGLVTIFVFGSNGELHHWPGSPQDAQISYSVVAAFLAASLPGIYTTHPAADPRRVA